MPPSRPLGDAPARSYAAKLETCAAFITPELRGVLAGLELKVDARVLDLGRGVGIAAGLIAGLLGEDGSWGERLRPDLTAAHWRELERNTRPGSDAYCLDRDDFHHIQTLTVCVGHG